MDKWSWKMDWCKRNGVGPGSFGIWGQAEKAWEEFVKRDSGLKTA